MSREIDISIVGATGYTGRLAVEFARTLNLKRREENKSELKLAFCARNQSSLNNILQLYLHGAVGPIAADSTTTPSATTAPTTAASTSLSTPSTFLIKDLSVTSSELCDMVNRSQVVCSYCGPFALYGEAVVKTCAEFGTHYVDVTAELHWMKKMELKYHDQFVAKEAKCMPCCGFDFLPNDLMMLQLKMLIQNSPTIKNWGGAEAMVSVHHACSQSTPMVSSGTAISAYHMLKSFSHPVEALRFYLNPYAIALTEKTKNISRLSLTQLFMLSDNYIVPRPLTSHSLEHESADAAKKIVILQDDRISTTPAEEPLLDGQSPAKRPAEEYCVKFCMSYLMNKYIHWSNEKQDFCFGKDLCYFGGEIRRNIVNAYFWSVMVWIGVVYLFLLSLLPVNVASFLLPRAGGPPQNPASDYLLTHLRAQWPQGDLQFKWRLRNAESYAFAARGCFMTAVTIIDQAESVPKVYGLVPPSVGVGPQLLDELNKYAGLELSAAQLRTY